jgi:hypothetical protein
MGASVPTRRASDVFILLTATAVPLLLMVASCTGPTIILTGCPEEEEVAAGTSFMLSAAMEDAEGNDVTAEFTFTYKVTQGPLFIAITGQGNSRTINIPADALVGATVIEVTGSNSDLGSGSADCRFTIVEPE